MSLLELVAYARVKTSKNRSRKTQRPQKSSKPIQNSRNPSRKPRKRNFQRHPLLKQILFGFASWAQGSENFGSAASATTKRCEEVFWGPSFALLFYLIFHLLEYFEICCILFVCFCNFFYMMVFKRVFMIGFELVFIGFRGKLLTVRSFCRVVEFFDFS